MAVPWSVWESKMCILFVYKRIGTRSTRLLWSHSKTAKTLLIAGHSLRKNLRKFGRNSRWSCCVEVILQRWFLVLVDHTRVVSRKRKHLEKQRHRRMILLVMCSCFWYVFTFVIFFPCISNRAPLVARPRRDVRRRCLFQSPGMRCRKNWICS